MPETTKSAGRQWKAFGAALRPEETRKAVVTTLVSDVAIAYLHLRELDYELEISKATLAIRQNSLKLTGYLGGYHAWEPVYKGWVNARGPVIESLTWVQFPGVFYALRGSADFSPTGPGGDKTHISFALHIDALPAFVMTPDASREVASVESYNAIAPAKKRRPSLLVIDGIVPDRTGKIQVGPNAVILPPPAATGQRQ